MRHETFRAMIARQVFYEGRVQGVGFRFTCKQIARGYEVVGCVRNLDDGRVELQCSGEPAEVEGFLEAIAESELKSHIKSVTAIPIPPLEGLRGFEVAL
jgi:acylphosphatase